MAKETIFVLNGPNLNLLGKREPSVYGTMTLAELDHLCVEQGEALGFKVICRQSNHEGDLIDWIHEAREKAGGLVINAGAYTHSSIALLDALRTLEIPAIEVHLSNIFQREAYRRHSYISEAAWAVISGLGPIGYQAAMIALADRIGQQGNKLQRNKKKSGKGSR